MNHDNPQFEPITFEEELTPDAPDKYLILVIYDITSNKTRSALSKYLLGFGLRVQKSAFECQLKETQYRKLLKGVAEFLKDPQDRLFIYKINTRAEVTRYGKTELPPIEDVIIL